MENIIGLISCLICAFFIFIVTYPNKYSHDPIPFWSGDTKIKDKVKNVKSYNLAMSKLYYKCSLSFVVSGVLFLVSPIIGTICLMFQCTLGIYLAWYCYKKILSKYS